MSCSDAYSVTLIRSGVTAGLFSPGGSWQYNDTINKGFLSALLLRVVQIPPDYIGLIPQLPKSTKMKYSVGGPISLY